MHLGSNFVQKGRWLGKLAAREELSVKAKQQATLGTVNAKF